MSRAAIDCPRCGKVVGADQDWCLSCGAAARTKITASGDWRLPVAAMAALVALSLAALAIAFVELTDDPAPPRLQPQITYKTVTIPPPAPTSP